MSHTQCLNCFTYMIIDVTCKKICFTTVGNNLYWTDSIILYAQTYIASQQENMQSSTMQQNIRQCHGVNTIAYSVQCHRLICTENIVKNTKSNTQYNTRHRLLQLVLYCTGSASEAGKLKVPNFFMKLYYQKFFLQI